MPIYDFVTSPQRYPLQQNAWTTIAPHVEMQLRYAVKTGSGQEMCMAVQTPVQGALNCILNMQEWKVVAPGYRARLAVYDHQLMVEVQTQGH